MNNRGAIGVCAHLRYIYVVCLGIICSAANSVRIGCVLKCKSEVPYAIRGYFPLLFRAVLDRKKVVHIVCPDLILVRIGMGPFGAVSRIIAFRPRTITKRTYAMTAKKQNAPSTNREYDTSNVRRPIEEWIL